MVPTTVPYVNNIDNLVLVSYQFGDVGVFVSSAVSDVPYNTVSNRRLLRAWNQKGAADE